MTPTQCDSCGVTFDLDEEGTQNVMPDDTNFAMCAPCTERDQRMVEAFYS